MKTLMLVLSLSFNVAHADPESLVKVFSAVPGKESLPVTRAVLQSALAGLSGIEFHFSNPNAETVTNILSSINRHLAKVNLTYNPSNLKSYKTLHEITSMAASHDQNSVRMFYTLSTGPAAQRVLLDFRKDIFTFLNAPNQYLPAMAMVGLGASLSRGLNKALELGAKAGQVLKYGAKYGGKFVPGAGLALDPLVQDKFSTYLEFLDRLNKYVGSSAAEAAESLPVQGQQENVAQGVQ